MKKANPRAFTVAPKVFLHIQLVLCFLLAWLAACPTSLGQDTNPFAPDIAQLQESPDEKFNQGDYEAAIQIARQEQEALGRFGINEALPVLIARSQLALGQYAEAKKTIEAGLERYQKSIQIRWVGFEVARFNGDTVGSLKLYNEIETLAKASAWRYRDTVDQLILGRYYLSKGADAKQVLKSFYQPALKKAPSDPEIYRAIGQLSLDKGDYQLAADNFRRLLKIRPNDADANFRMAECFAPSDAEASQEFLQKALTINPHHVGARLMSIDAAISSEAYAKAEQQLQSILERNAKQPQALAYMAALAHLQNELKRELELRDQALASWIDNPEVDYIIGRELSEKYRFTEGEKYQRRALVFDSDYLPAKVQLAHDLLRLGQEEEGWKLAAEVFDDDQYSVLAHNLLELRDEMSQFETLSKDGFVVRMARDEAAIYGDRVLDLLDRVSQSLAKKYQVSLQKPIVVEIFSRQRDFAIRTFGLPGGEGFLGVCFGRVITMNSPAAQRNLTSWESVLWHEFCHVVTLQKTRNKMPRWLSEGISVYEEKKADSAWGESMSQTYRDMLLNELTPVSQLSGAFLRPPSGAHLQFAYFESSLVVEYIIDNHGLDKLIRVLDELSLGTRINAALAKHIEPIETLDQNFREHATRLANQFAPKADWSEPKQVPPNAKLPFWTAWNESHPNNLKGLIAEAELRLGEDQFEDANRLLDQVVQLCPEEPSAYLLQSMAYRGLQQRDDEYQSLQAFVARDANQTDAWLRLVDLAAEKQDWQAVIQYAERAIALNPLIKPPYLALARASEAIQDPRQAAQALRTLVQMEPLDVAGAHFRLAQAYYQLDNFQDATRQVLVALENAPRYRAAHQLLLKITRQAKTSKHETADAEQPAETEASSDVPPPQPATAKQAEDQS